MDSISQAEPLEELYGPASRFASSHPRPDCAHLDVLENREALKEAHVLKGTNDAAPRTPVRRQARHVGTAEADPAVRWTLEAAQRVDERRLAGAIRPDQPEDLPLVDDKVDAIQGVNAIEIDAKSFRPQRSPLPLVLVAVDQPTPSTGANAIASTSISRSG
jgi:hypothetical protein